MPPTFLFDIGNVILAFDFSVAARRLASKCAVSPEEALEVVSSLSPPLERGEMTPDEFVATASEAIGYSGEPRLFLEAIADIFELNEPIVALIETLAERGHPLHLLSNTNDIHVPFFERTYEVFGHFAGRIYSHRVGSMKPDPEIYEFAISELGLVPSETIYIDDLPENVEAGRRAGLQSFCYDRSRHDQLLEELSSLPGLELGEPDSGLS